MTRLDITYDTPPEKLENFIEGIKQIILQHSSTRKDYFHVVLNDYEESSLRILVYFFLKVPDWSIELKEKQTILLGIHHLASQLKVSFAFPTRRVYFEASQESKDSLVKE